MKSPLLAVVFASSSAVLLAADSSSITGNWTFHSNIAGSEFDTICTFTQKEADLTGTCKSDNGGNKITGKIDGMKISFSYLSEYNGSPLTEKFAGTFDPAAAKISGTVKIEEYGADGSFTATPLTLATVTVSTAAAEDTATQDATAQQAREFLGRWDLISTPANGKPYPQWIELVDVGGKLGGRIQPKAGAWYAIAGGHMESGKLIVPLGVAGSGSTASWELASSGAGKLTGIEKRNGVADGLMLVGLKAPSLDRPIPKKWTTPTPLFNGKDLRGWEPAGSKENNKWVARNGELVNDNPEVPGQSYQGAANIMTTEKFQDFKLHIEVNCPEGGNSGIYLRGRYEVQVGTEGGTHPTHEMGAIYSYYPPPEGSELGLGKWTTFDITLVGRHVTVLRDGKMYHDNVEIPGPTGGALDSNEGDPGPFLLQGDHHGVVAYRNVTISVPEK